jgi:hypothetical protein
MLTIILVAFFYILIGYTYSIICDDETNGFTYIILWPLILFCESFDFIARYIAKSIKNKIK